MKQVQYGMVGGDLKALIGEVHRKGLAFDPRAELVCGCFSAIDELNVECADYYNVDKSRILCIMKLQSAFWSMESALCAKNRCALKWQKQRNWLHWQKRKTFFLQ